MSSLFTASKIRILDFSIDFCIFFINFSIGCSISAKSKYVEEYLQSFCIKASTQDVLMGVLGFSKDIRDKKISQEKRKFLLKLSERIPYRTETETLVDYSCICIFNRK